jgi:lipopolysaccharide export system protein LptA
MRKLLVFLIVLLFVATSTYAQKSNTIKILHAKKLTEGRSANHQKLVGNVGLQNKDMQLFCDSAEVDNINNAFWAWGKVYIIKSNNLKAYGDSLVYNNYTGIGKLQGKSVKVTQKDLTILTNVLNFDDSKKQIFYLNGATITNAETKIVSKLGYYNTQTEFMDLIGKVFIDNPDYKIWGDTIIVDSPNEITRFYGKTNIHTKDQKIYCERGLHNDKNEIFHFVKKASIKGDENTICADSIYVNKKKKISWAFKNVQILDSINQLTVYGNVAYFNQKDSNSYVSRNPWMTQVLDGDTLWVRCDTIKAIDKKKIKEFYAYHNVKMFKKDMQGVCDSLSYSLSDSIMRMYRNPILWSEESQMKGDTIQILTARNKIKNLYLFSNASIISEQDKKEEFYDQIVGRNMIADFKEGKIHTMSVLGNGQTLYYAKDNDSTYSGVNKAICSNLSIRFNKGKIGKIVFLLQPEATFYPVNQLPAEDKKLKQFTWHGDRRPKSYLEIINSKSTLKK